LLTLAPSGKQIGVGARKQVFRIDASERNRRKFYKLCDEMNIDQDLLEPPTTVDGGDRSGIAFHVEPEEYGEMGAVSAYFEIFKAATCRLAFRIGMAALTEKVNELYPEEGEGHAEEESNAASQAV